MPKTSSIRLAILVEIRLVKDTDKQTQRRNYYCASTASSGKNCP